MLSIGVSAIPQSQLFGVKESTLLQAEAKTSVVGENLSEWVRNDKRRMLHAVYSVGDLDKTIKYVSSFFSYMVYVYFFNLSV